MKTQIALTRNPQKFLFEDNDGSTFGTHKIFLESTIDVIDRGYLLLVEGTTEEMARVLLRDDKKVIVEELSNNFTTDAFAIPLAADNSSPGIPETAPGAVFVEIFPSLCAANDINADRDDIKYLKTEVDPVYNFIRRMSRNIILSKDLINDAQVNLNVRFSKPNIFSRGSTMFYETSNVSLDISSIPLNNQFVDIYIEDSGSSPIINGTKRIALYGKGSGVKPYTTSPSAGQYIVGSLYIKNSKIIGIDSLFAPNFPSYHFVENSAYGLSIVETNKTDDGSSFYIPIFKQSILNSNIMLQARTDTTNPDIWGFQVYLNHDEANESIRSTHRIKAVDTSVNYGYIPITINSWCCYGGKYTTEESMLENLYISGNLRTDDTSNLSQLDIRKVSGFFVVDNQVIQPALEEDEIVTSGLTVITSPFATNDIVYDLKLYNNYMYASGYLGTNGWVKRLLLDSGVLNQIWADGIGSDQHYRMHKFTPPIYNECLFIGRGCYGTLTRHLYPNDWWPSMVEPYCFAITDYRNKLITGGGLCSVYTSPGDGAQTRIFRNSDPGGDPSDTRVYVFKVFNGNLYWGTDQGNVYKYNPGIGHLIVLNKTSWPSADQIRDMEVFDDILVVANRYNIQYSINGDTFNIIPRLYPFRPYRLMTIKGYLFACGGDYNGGSPIPQLYATNDPGLIDWQEIPITGISAGDGYFITMEWDGTNLWLATDNTPGKPKLVKGSIGL